MTSSFIGAQISEALGSGIDWLMKGIWAAAVGLLRGAFELVDSFTTVNFLDVNTVVVGIDGTVGSGSPIGTIWPLMRWLSLAIALGLFLLQLATAMLRGGRGLFRVATGPLAYAVAIGMTAGVIGLLFAAGDGITTALLQRGLRADGFVGVLNADAAHAVFSPTPTLDADPTRAARGAEAASQFDATARAVTLGLLALFGVVPAALGFALEMLFRLVAFLALVATSPIFAAGLLAEATASWYWRGLRWAIAAAVMKPGLAVGLIIAVSVMSAPTGLAGLLAGTLMLLLALFVPFVIYRMLAFVDPGTNAGAAARANWSARRRSGNGGEDTAEGDSGSAETANTARFDAAGRSRPGPEDPGSAGPGGGGASGGSGGGSGSGSGTSAGASSGAGAAGGAAVGGVLAAGAAVAAAGRAAGRFAHQTMDATAVGHPHGGNGSAQQGPHPGTKGGASRHGSGGPAAAGRNGASGSGQPGYEPEGDQPGDDTDDDPRDYGTDYGTGYGDPGYRDRGDPDPGYGDLPSDHDRRGSIYDEDGTRFDVDDPDIDRAAHRTRPTSPDRWGNTAGSTGRADGETAAGGTW